MKEILFTTLLLALFALIGVYFIQSKHIIESDRHPVVSEEPRFKVIYQQDRYYIHLDTITGKQYLQLGTIGIVEMRDK